MTDEPPAWSTARQRHDRVVDRRRHRGRRCGRRRQREGRDLPAIAHSGDGDIILRLQMPADADTANLRLSAPMPVGIRFLSEDGQRWIDAAFSVVTPQFPTTPSEGRRAVRFSNEGFGFDPTTLPSLYGAAA
ncbi:MAG: hypothetical protein R2705_18635 [Ilumatobacteraceae bacterium]